MKKYIFIAIYLLILTTLTSCEAVETIFKAGMYWGFILVIVVIGLIFWLFTRGNKS